MTSVTCPTVAAVLARAAGTAAHAHTAPMMQGAQNRDEAVCVITYLSGNVVGTSEGGNPLGLANTACT